MADNLPRNLVGLPVEGRPRQADAVTVRSIAMPENLTAERLQRHQPATLIPDNHKRAARASRAKLFYGKQLLKAASRLWSL